MRYRTLMSATVFTSHYEIEAQKIIEAFGMPANRSHTKGETRAAHWKCVGGARARWARALCITRAVLAAVGADGAVTMRPQQCEIAEAQPIYVRRGPHRDN